MSDVMIFLILFLLFFLPTWMQLIQKKRGEPIDEISGSFATV